MSTDLFSPDGAPWCHFEGGSIRCANRRQCRNPGHLETRRGLEWLILHAPTLGWFPR